VVGGVAAQAPSGLGYLLENQLTTISLLFPKLSGHEGSASGGHHLAAD
jgi:uncharacterized circularly permuted ATP-grasp superfamily protein